MEMFFSEAIEMFSEIFSNKDESGAMSEDESGLLPAEIELPLSDEMGAIKQDEVELLSAEKLSNKDKSGATSE